MLFTITPLFALIISVIYMGLWMRVTALRADKSVSIGDAGHTDLLLRIRQHGNCAEWSGFILILMILAEGSLVSSTILYAAGALLVLGRIAHPFGLKADNAGHVLRYVGNGSNILSVLILMGALAYAHLIA